MPVPLHATADIPAHSCSHLKEITQFSNEVWKSKHAGGERNGEKSGGLWRNSLHVVTAHRCLLVAVLIVRYGGPWGLAQKCGPGKGTSVREGDRFSKQARSRCTNITGSPAIQVIPLAPVDGSPIEAQQWMFPKMWKIIAFSGSGRTEWGNVKCLCPQKLAIHHTMKFFFLFVI